MIEQTIVSNITAENCNDGVRVICMGFISGINQLSFDNERFEAEFISFFRDFAERNNGQNELEKAA